MNSESSGPLARIIRAATKVEPNELRATVLSFLFVFTLMAAYFIIRPVRDAMASDWTRAETSTLWTMTFFFSVIGVSAYAFIISRVRFSRVVPGVYIFFSASFVLFYLGSGMVADPTVVDHLVDEAEVLAADRGEAALDLDHRGRSEVRPHGLVDTCVGDPHRPPSHPRERRRFDRRAIR